ncbi:MAG: cell division protein FtsW [Candidatus Niyogibacteria bacterium]|nr:cell division protein FtsW [Candidatus Niyogibacteria bacterium]
MPFLKTYDKPFAIIFTALVLFGLLALASASLGQAAKEGISFYNYLSRQIILGLGLGGILFFLGLRLPYKLWRRLALIVFLTGLGLMFLVYVPYLGFSHGGARRWLNFGYFFLQPVEFLKFGFIVYLSSWMASRKEQLSSFEFGLAPFFVFLGLIGILLFSQPDMGSFGIIGLTALVLFFIGGAKKSHLAAIIILGLIAAALLVAFEPYRLSRFMTFIKPDDDLRGAGWQLRQSLIAIGSGNVFGKGLGRGIQKFDYLPEAAGDSIFAVIAEEFGFLGGFFLIAAFLFFLWRGLFIAKNAPDVFGRLLAAGFVILVILQSFIHIGGLVGIFPLTGLPLVFISQGGSSLAVSFLMVGVILNISKYS